MEGWIKLHRKFANWEWYNDSNMVHLFLYCLLKANHKPKKWKGIIISRGQYITGLTKMKKETGISIQSLRTCINRLKSTHEITIKSTSKYSVITVVNYDDYQVMQDSTNRVTNRVTNKQLTNNQQTTNKQLTTTKNDKNEKNEKNENKIVKKEQNDFKKDEAEKLLKDILDITGDTTSSVFFIQAIEKVGIDKVSGTLYDFKQILKDQRIKNKGAYFTTMLIESGYIKQSKKIVEK